MNKKTIGIVVINDDEEVLYLDDSYIIKIEENKDLVNTLEDKLKDLLGQSVRADSIVKNNKIDGMDMFTANVYLYQGNSNFKHKEVILEYTKTPRYKEYFMKYIVKKEEYRLSIESRISILFYLTIIIGSNIIPREILVELIFEHFILTMLIVIVLPNFILYKFVSPKLTNYFATRYKV